MRSTGRILGAGLAGLAAAAASAAAAVASFGDPLLGTHHGCGRYPNGLRQFQRGHRIRPHQGKREIMRRLRQEERDEQNQIHRALSQNNAGRRMYPADVTRVSRRGRILA